MYVKFPINSDWIDAIHTAFPDLLQTLFAWENVPLQTQ